MGKILTQVPQAGGPGCIFFTSMKDAFPSLHPKPTQHSTGGTQPCPDPHSAADVGDWELALLGTIWANTDRQLFNERRHAAFNLRAVSTQRLFIRLSLLQHSLAQGHPQAMPRKDRMVSVWENGTVGAREWREVRAVWHLLHAGPLHGKINFHQKKACEEGRV